MLRNDHQLMIEQDFGGIPHYTVLRLQDQNETKDGKLVVGKWKHTNQSYNDDVIKLTSDSPEYLYWEWKGGPHGGKIELGSKMGRASHKAGETEFFQVLVTFDLVKRQANGSFKVGSVLESGAGSLKYNVNPHFKSGDILWTVVRYER